MADELRLGFVSGTTPDKWARAWRERQREHLVLVPVTEEDQEGVVRRGEVDLCLVRLPIETDGLHCVRLYDELPVAVAHHEHLISAAADLVLDDLDDEQLVRPHASGWRPSADQRDWPPMTQGEAIEAVAAGTGVVLVPLSVARLHHRKDVVHREVTDLPPTTVALVWRREHNDETTQAFVGVVRGRTAHSSRG